MIVPITVGSGIRTKILYAMAQGIPVVSTSIGCEGIDISNNENLYIANTPKEFSDSIDRIIQHPEQTFKMLIKSQNIIKEKYSQKIASDIRIKHFENILEN